MWRGLLSALMFALIGPGLARAQSPDSLSLEDYLKPYSIRSVCFSPAEDEIAFVSDRSGHWQPYVMPSLGGRWVRVVDTPDEVSAITWCPAHRDRLFFLMDRNGDGQPHLYQAWLQAKRYEDETPFAGSRAQIIGWSRDGGNLYYACNQRADSLMDVYRYDVENWKSERVFLNPGPYVPISLSRDDRSLILTVASADSIGTLYALELAKKSLSELPPQDYKFPEFSPCVPATALHMSFHGTFVWGAVAGHWKIQNTSTGHVILPPRPLRDRAEPLGFSRSERYLLARINSDTLPGDVYLWDRGKNSVLQLTNGFGEKRARHKEP